MPIKQKIDWEAAYAMQDKETMFLLYAVSEGLCRYIDDFSTHFDFEGSIVEEVQTLVVAGFLEESDGHLDVTERGRFVLGDLANSSKSPGSAESHILNVNDHIIKSPLREPLKDSAFDEPWRFDPAQETESSVFNWGEKPEDMQTESQTRVFDVLRVIDEQPEDMQIESSDSSVPQELERLLSFRHLHQLRTAQRSSVPQELERLLPLQRQAPRRHYGESVSKFDSKFSRYDVEGQFKKSKLPSHLFLNKSHRVLTGI